MAKFYAAAAAAAVAYDRDDDDNHATHWGASRPPIPSWKAMWWYSKPLSASIVLYPTARPSIMPRNLHFPL